MNQNQISFLQSYQNNNGDIRSAITDNGLELNHYRLWMQEDEFKQQFKIIRTEIIYEQLAEFKVLIVQQLNQLLSRGYEEKTVTRTTTTNKNGRTTVKQSVKITRKPVPIAMIKDLLKSESLEASIINLSEKGVIPKTIARNLLSTANQYTQKLRGAFGVESEDNKMNDEKTIALIKQALIGSGEEIN